MNSPWNQVYRWRHVLTGTEGTRTIEASLQEMLVLLNRWNAQQPGVWVYWINP